MASILDAFNDALTEDLAYVKIAVFAIPTYFVAKMFVVGDTRAFEFLGVFLGLFVLAQLTIGIHNVRMNRKEILSYDFPKLGLALLKSLIVLIPQAFLFGSIGYCLTTKVEIPDEIPQLPAIYSILVWAIICSIVLTAYLSFAKYLKILQGFNYKVIFESCIDVLISFFFFMPQLVLANVVLVGPVVYLFSIFNLPFTHWGFIAYGSVAFIINISILANYLAQSAYEQIKGNNEEYDENVQMNVIDLASERLNGR